MDPPIVAGVDESPAAPASVEIAAHEALLRRVVLRIVHAVRWPAMHPPPIPSPLGPADGGVRGAVARGAEG